MRIILDLFYSGGGGGIARNSNDVLVHGDVWKLFLSTMALDDMGGSSEPFAWMT